MARIPDKLNRKVTRILHDQGIELTPKQVRAVRKKAYAKIREEMRRRGYKVPAGDLELLAWMKKLGL